MSCSNKYYNVELGSYPGYVLNTGLCNTYDENVYKVQEALTEMSGQPDGGNLDPGGVDGYYGDQTARAVLDFQQRYPGELEPDCEVGINTWIYLSNCHG
jgi:peptidoglycan hydrolase-like protein with peptidoglycan-binding domain